MEEIDARALVKITHDNIKIEHIRENPITITTKTSTLNFLHQIKKQLSEIGVNKRF